MKKTTKAMLQVASLIPLTWERLESGVALNLLSRSFVEDPYPLYARILEKDPVHRVRTAPMWAVTRYDDIQTVLRDHQRFSNRDFIPDPSPNGDAQPDAHSGYGYSQHRLETLLELDPPDHTRLRSLVSRAFTPRAVARLEQRIAEVTDKLIEEIGDAPRFDLISSLAYPLPVTVIAEMIGVPARDMDRFAEWSDVLALSIEPILDKSQTKAIERCNRELGAYFEEIIEQRSQEPQDDLISALLAIEEQGDRLTHEELLGVLMLLLVAGNETTRNLIGNGMLALLNHPDQLQLLRDDPDLVPSAVNEILRFDGPVQFAVRTLTEDVELGGRQMSAGQQIITLLGAGNRDPSVFSDPHTFDVRRDERPHLTFGYGIHYCLGAALAIMEARIALQALLKRFPRLRVAKPPTRRQRVVLRGLRELWLEVDGEGT